MNSLFLRVLLAFVGLVVLLLLIGSFLPRDFDVDTEIDIEAPLAVVFAQIDDLKNWKSWTNWNTNDIPDLEVDYGVETRGVGATMRWTDARGDGKLWITHSEPHSRVDYQLEFLNFKTMESQFQLSEKNGATHVVWNSRGRLPSGPFYGWFGFLFEQGLQSEYDKNLEKLKMVSEREADKPTTKPDDEQASS